MSTKLTPMAFMRMRASPRSGCFSSTACRVSTSGPPYCLTTMALILFIGGSLELNCAAALTLAVLVRTDGGNESRDRKRGRTDRKGALVAAHVVDEAADGPAEGDRQ